jgi:tRNA U34 2-thiouridine synthase MnmA/TrmU
MHGWLNRTANEFCLRAVDLQKDQSYVLSVLGQKELGRAVFPLGGLSKPEVRAYARQRGLAIADRPESQDLCFLAGEDYRTFLQRTGVDGLSPGPILTRLASCPGAQWPAGYTIGQSEAWPGIERAAVVRPRKTYPPTACCRAATVLAAAHFERSRSTGFRENRLEDSSRPVQCPLLARQVGCQVKHLTTAGQKCNWTEPFQM